MTLTVNPASVVSAHGTAINQRLVPTGGAAPYTFASNLVDVKVDASGNVTGTPAAAETGAITVRDGAAATANVPITIN
jgi:hypothetical protein